MHTVIRVLPRSWAFAAIVLAGGLFGAVLTAPIARAQTALSASGGYSYSPDGRRDPFSSLLRRGSDRLDTDVQASGLDALPLEQVALKGIIETEGEHVALVQAPDGRTYLVRRNTELRDARVKAVTADAVVFTQQLDDPLSLVKEREVTKPLRAREEGQ